MADVLEAMGFPREWCEQALRRSNGIEPAVELLLQWPADGGAPSTAEDPSALSTLLSPPHPSGSVATVSTVTDPLSSAAGLDAVVPDAGGDGQILRFNETERLKVHEEELEKIKARKSMVDGKVNGNWHGQLAAAPALASGSNSGDKVDAASVELHIRCSGYPTIKGAFSAGATLKEVRDFYLQQLQNPQLQQPVEMPSTMAINRQSRRTSRSNGNGAILSSERVSQRSRKTSRYGDLSSSASTSGDLATKTLYFLIPFPRVVFDTEVLMETTLSDANLFPRGILTAQFRTKGDPSPSEHVNNPHDYSDPSGQGVQFRHAHVPTSQSLQENLIVQRVEDMVMRERRLKATLDRYGSEQGSEIATSGTIDVGIGATSMPAPAVLPSAAAATIRLVRSRERNLEVDGERVRHRELALQAAAKRMTEAAQMFREGFMPDEEPARDICTLSDLQPVPSTTSNDESRSIAGNLDCKGKQVADCGTSQPAELRVQDVGSNIVGFRGRTPRIRSPLPSSSASRPEKLQRIDELNNSSVAENRASFFASGHTIDCAVRRGEAQESSLTERLHPGSPGSRSSAVSELKIRLEDGSVLQHTFPAHTTLLSVCEFAIPGRFSVAEHGLILPMTGSQFFEGESLNSTLQQVGLVPRGVVHLQNLTSRGLVTRGRRRTRRVMRYHQRDNEPEPELEQLWQDFSRHMNTNLTYEELVELEDSIGRVNVGVPEATIAELPTHAVSRNAGDICIVCLSEMMEGEEVMVLPCVHTFHPACIRRWLLQSTCCPTCKYIIS